MAMKQTCEKSLISLRPALMTTTKAPLKRFELWAFGDRSD
jgi:hypothetical protein